MSRRDLRVAILTREFPPEVYGGAGVHVDGLTRALAAHVDVAVHCVGEPRNDRRVAAAYRPWEALAMGAVYAPALETMSVNLAMVAGVEGADVVHSHTWYANLAGHLAKLCHGVPHVVTTHSLEPLRPWKAEQLGGGYALSRYCERTALEAADAVIAVSVAMRDDVLACYPEVDPVRLEVVHNGIDPKVWRPDEDTDVLEQLGVEPGLPTVAYVGRITRQKGLPYLLEAAARLDHEAQLVLVTGSPDTPQVAAEVPERVAALRGTGLRVVWVERMLPTREVAQVLTHATVFVCPSVYEPFGLVNLEAMACQVPVVASAVGGIPEIVVDGETGLLVPLEAGGDPSGAPADPARFARDLADRLDTLLGDPALAASMGNAGRTRVLEHFTWPAIATRTAAVYHRVAGASTTGSV